ncbi:MAG: UPF0158 family protein [Pyrinomonadaceae bacterium]
MPLPVKLNDIIEALEEAGEEHSHYLDKRTGEIVLITNEEMEAAEEDELISEISGLATRIDLESARDT